MELYNSRIKKVRCEMKSSGLDQLMITDSKSIYYLTGIEVFAFERFWAFLLCGDGRNILFANKLFALGETGFETVTFVDTDDVSEVTAPYISGGSMGVDKNMPARFLLPMMEKNSGVEFSLGSDCVDNVRACKDEAEKVLMREASRINDLCIEKAAAFVHDGVTEKECADYILRCFDECGCEGPSFAPIVSFGANAADPHHEPDDTVIKEGDCVVIDMGCKYKGYCSDMTRTYFWKKADPKYASIYETVREANEKAESLVKAGVCLCDLDLAARNHISNSGYGEYFTHRLGHFIGLEEHEKGDVSSVNTAKAKSGMVFSIEPGVYLPGEFGVRIEDLVLVTDDGCEILNLVSKEIKILGL